MLLWIKKFWREMSESSRPVFFQKYVLPFLALFFTWGLIGNIVLINIDTNSLQKKTGEVTEINIKIERGKYTHYPLYIKLKNNQNEFRLTDTFENNFSNLQDQILKGDRITLYIRYKWQAILGWGKYYDIYQIDKDGKTLFNLSTVISEKKSQVKIFVFFSLILWGWYFINRL